MEISVTLTNTPKQKPADESSLGFGKFFSDHMFIMEYEEGKGWMNPRIEPYHRLSLDPASSVLHYAQEIFEGLKAYRRADGSIVMFRPWDNCKRLNKSAERMCMPEIDVDFNVEAMRKLVEVEKDWVPHTEGTSLYLRPTMIANDEALGVHAAKRYIYYIICAPSGAYYPTGLAPIKIKVEDKYVRAVRGGMGFAKTGGNYACSIKAGADAGKEGFSQVLWLDGQELKYVQEVGAMNMMFLIDDKLVTAPLDGAILPGITRDSILTLARSEGITVEERRLSVDELMTAADNGHLREAFGTGTAAVVSPVGHLCYRDHMVQVNDGGIGKLTQHFYDTLTGIQWGKVEDRFNWIKPVC
ncbi:MAG: branched-chain amino acid aminotransferase [Eubacteriales bacterium]|nr:branched-chain amino acid aminotransferase [Eubacteriales bacterium]MCI7570135.1 branched-chain amino acid aminotransferase [Clostridiales bacterium]MDD7550558.1 branched-chain amino acid aminotransferase [Clostridia bacterium]MDY5754686.1 branched-chain amino acid aminotransferase [Eubacteriales bacterium]